MFYDNPNCTILSSHIDAYGTKSGIFLFKNIIPEELMEKIENNLEELEQKEFKDDIGLISWYRDKTSPVVDGMYELWKFISDILYPEYMIHPQLISLKVKPGDGGMFVHSDSPGKHQCHLLSQDDRWSTCCILDFGGVAYMGNFTGGAIFYPCINPDGTVKTETNNQDGCYEYFVERGDFIVHSAFEPYSHGVREVETGVRYALPVFSIKAEDNPGTFFNYKSKEWYEQVGSESLEEVMKWSIPLKVNDQFTDNKLEIMRNSGLEGKELSSSFFKKEDFVH